MVKVREVASNSNGNSNRSPNNRNNANAAERDPRTPLVFLCCRSSSRGTVPKCRPRSSRRTRHRDEIGCQRDLAKGVRAGAEVAVVVEEGDPLRDYLGSIHVVVYYRLLIFHS